MIIYLLKSTACLAILLAIYHLFLEKEKMHQFNRFYLLGSILFSFLAPNFTIYTNPAIVIESISNVQFLTNATIKENTINFNSLLIILYGVISVILLIRFSKNVFDLIYKIKSNTKIPFKKATLVLLPEKLIPHTFLSYIFINKNEFQSNKLEKEIFEHELTHVKEKHTIDIIIVELLQAICWFNPLIIYLKRAIKLNHEFIADGNVIQSYNNTTAYQYLLLSRISQNKHSYLASNFNYLLTKKRLIMMTKQSSQLKMLFKKIAIIPMAIALLFVFANRVEAKEIGVNSVNKSEIIYQEKVTPKMILEYNALAKKYNSNHETIFKKEEVERLKYIYSLMSEKQKETAESFPNIPPPPPPTKKEIKKHIIDSNGDELIIGHQITNPSISENDVRHPSILNYTAYAEKFLELQTPSESDLKKLDKLYNDIPLSEKASLMTPDYILNNKDVLKKIIKDSKNKK